MNEIDLLITRRLTATATQDEIQRLEAWIVASPSNARQYAAEVFAYRCIQDAIQGEAQIDRRITIGSNKPTIRRIATHGVLRNLAAAVLLMVSMVGIILLAVADAEPPAHVAFIVGNTSFKPGMAPQGEQVLTQGVLTLQFASTAKVVLEAPARFEIIDPMQILLHEGQAVVLCPTQAAYGFTVQTPSCTLIDLGTEFGVAVASDGSVTSVVFTGAIKVEPPDAQPVRLEAGDAWQVDALGIGTRLSVADTPRFVRHAEAELMHRLAQAGLATQWAATSKSLTDDSSLLLWLDMNPINSEDRLINRADPLGPSIDRIVASGESLRLTPGRFADDQAIRFEKASDPLRINLPGEHEALTFAAWVMLDEVDTSQITHRGLVMSDGWGDRGQVHWQAKGHDFRLSFFDRGDEIDPRFAASPQGMVPGRWQLLTSVIDRRAKQVRHYLNGKIVDRRGVEANLPPLTIGQATIGGWLSEQENLRVLEGTIDELLIWSRALSDAEVQGLYEISRMKTN